MKLMEFFTYDDQGAKEDHTYDPEHDISILDKDDFAMLNRNEPLKKGGGKKKGKKKK